jgi:carbamoyl-phosphate synthase small subunit
VTTRSALALEDGSVFRGAPFGAAVDARAEVVFNTCMTGYQEISTDPSYRGQMVAMTYPLIGVYGASDEARESRQPWISALIVREYYDDPSNWTAELTLADFLTRWHIPAVSGIDTRALTRRLRAKGTMRAVLAYDAGGRSDEQLVAEARSVVALSKKDLVAETSCAEPHDWPGTSRAGAIHVVVVDCGVKENILRSLARHGVRITVVPHDARASDIVALGPAGVVVSNGPGDPVRLTGAVETMRGLLEARLPVMGICLGHQILGLAIGGTTSRLRFGHHGGNHPVLDVRGGNVHITSQNHEFQVDAESLPTDSGFYISQVNLNDRSVEGLAHAERPVFSVQYHPEGSPGPQDNQYLFQRFVATCETS